MSEPILTKSGKIDGRSRAAREARRQRQEETVTMDELESPAAEPVAVEPAGDPHEDCMVRIKQPVPVLWEDVRGRNAWRRRGDVFRAKRGTILVLRKQADRMPDDAQEMRAPTGMQSLEGDGVM